MGKKFSPTQKVLTLGLTLISAFSFGFQAKEISGQELQRLAVSHVKQESQKQGFDALDVQDLAVTGQSASLNKELTHLYLAQKWQGIEIHGAVGNVTLRKSGEFVRSSASFLHQVAKKVLEQDVKLSQAEAIEKAAKHLGFLSTVDLTQVESKGGAERHAVFNGAGISHDNIPVSLKYFPNKKEELKLVWSLVIRQINSDDWWNLYVDVQDGEVVWQKNWTIYDVWAPRQEDDGRGHRPNHKAIEAAQKEGAGSNGSYFVSPLPYESINHGPMDLVTDPADPTASPFGWHDTNGVAGPEFTTTEGNNVHAYEDRDGNDQPSIPSSDPDGGAGLVFNVTPDFDLEPNTYTDAATINLFYWNNIIHDVLFHYGFDETVNFQEMNYGGQGFGGDSVNAQSQSRADLAPSNETRNNANFSTPSDGINPRMRMYEWTGPVQMTLTITAPGNIAGVYTGEGASFGGTTGALGLTTDLVLVDDGDDQGGTASTSDGCQALINGGALSGNIAVIDRGSCEFGLKALNAQNAGAVAVIVINNLPGSGTFGMGAGAQGGQVTIPTAMITYEDGQILKSALSQGTVTGNYFLDGVAPVNRDSDFDNGVIIHEYGHGISNRLVGGPNNVGCLGGEEQTGEGWSDFLALAFTHLPNDTADMARGIGTYASYEAITGPGIRPFRYTRDMNVNPSTYDTIKDTATITVPHGVGTIWCTMLWDLYWNFIDAYGYDSDLYSGTGGNNMAINLVMEAMKIQPCSATFVDQRDSILTADENLYGGANQCLIWQTFARRGLGLNADGGTPASRTDGTEDFTVPAECSCSAPSITGQPTSQSLCRGETLNLSVTSQGTGLTYQWQLNGQNLTGETASTLTVADLQPADFGTYTCLVSNDCGSEVSGNAVITQNQDFTFSTANAALWQMTFPDGSCGDLGTIGVVDLFDLVNSVNIQVR